MDTEEIIGTNGLGRAIGDMAACTCVVTVTYGNRFQFLKQVIQAAFENEVCKVIVVDNASEPESHQAI